MAAIPANAPSRAFVRLPLTVSPMTTLSLSCCWLLDVTFAVAALGKMRNRRAVAAAAVGLGAPAWSAPLLVPTEVLVVVLLLFMPVVGAGAAAALLATFTVLVARVVRSKRSVVCGCFGARSDAPVTSTTVARNLGLLSLCVPAAFAKPVTSLSLTGTSVVVVVLVAGSLAVGGLMIGALLDVRRTTGSLFPTPREA